MKDSKIAKIIYEATRLEAKWSNRPIIPEKWEKRDKKFKKQLIETIGKYLKMKRLPSPEEAHNNWIKEYLAMGWKYGKTRNPIRKTHPDLVSYKKLPRAEKEKDAIFLSFVWLVRSLKKEGKIKKKNTRGQKKNKITSNF